MTRPEPSTRITYWSNYMTSKAVRSSSMLLGEVQFGFVCAPNPQHVVEGGGEYALIVAHGLSCAVFSGPFHALVTWISMLDGVHTFLDGLV